MTWHSSRTCVGLLVFVGSASVAACGGPEPGPPAPGTGGTAVDGTGGASTGGQTAAGGSGGQTVGAGGSSGGLGGSAGGGTGGVTELIVSDDFDVSVHLASEELETAPTTVGIVTWSLEGEVPEEAYLEFGLTDEYGMVAPVDLDEPDFRTLLLGMKPERSYHFRVVASAGGVMLTSPDHVLETGPATELVFLPEATVLDDAMSAGGFIVSSYWQGETRTMAFIVDADGDIVWWHDAGFSGGVAQASMSADGQSMWLVTASNSGAPLVRVSMDGLEEETYEDTDGSHAIAPVVDDVMAFVDYGETDCDSLFEINSSGNVQEIVELSDPEYVGIANDGGDTTNCHGNAVTYNEERDLYAFSSYGEDVFIVPRSGGTPTKLSQIVPGGNESWGAVQHGAQVLADSLLVFANYTAGNRSSFIEYSLATGDVVESYDPGIFSANLGDVQRLPGGNTLVTFSNAGIMHEITPDGDVVFELSADGQRMGYATWRASLYGLPAETQQN